MTQQQANSINKAIRSRNGNFLSSFYNISYIRNHQQQFSQFCDQNIESLINDDFWSDALLSIFEMSQAPTEKDEFKSFTKSVMSIIRNFKELDPAVSAPVVKCIAQSLRYFAHAGEYSDSAALLQQLLSLQHKSRTSDDSTFLCISNELISVYFMRNNFKQVMIIINLVEEKRGINFDKFESEQLAEFYFNKGKCSAVMLKKDNYRDSIQEAIRYLKLALTKTPMNQRMNRRLVYTYLIPLQLCLLEIPSHELMDAYNLHIFRPFVDAVYHADINLFDQSLKEVQLTIIKLGLLDLMIKVRQIIFLRLLQLLHRSYGSPKLPTTLYQQTLNLFIPIEFNETECIIASLIKDGYVKAYMSHNLKTIVFSKENPFPPIKK